MHDADGTNGNALPYKVETDLDVLGVLMLNGVGEHVDGSTRHLKISGNSNGSSTRPSVCSVSRSENYSAS